MIQKNGELTISDAFIKSSNIFSKIINDSYNDNLGICNRGINFDLRSKSDLSYSNNLFKTIQMKEGLKLVSAHGKDMKCPMYILTFYNAANDKMVNPTFIDMIKKQRNVICKKQS